MFDPEIPASRPGPWDWADLFGRSAAVELELGFGKGRFLLESARAQPATDFVGVELSRKWFRDAKRRMQKHEDCPENLRIVCAEAMDLLARKVPDASLAALHVYHPDPWPKRRHHKRRLLGPRFLAEATRAIAPGGELRVTTDHAGYAARIAALLAAPPGFAAMDWPADALPNTHFEAKYRLEGRPIHRFRLRREES
ncbi:MAG: tRNA (guanosine(46)-N7)-methyltransferase TrmB [Candidatus Krumholzibacteriia bacterium]|nr:tRNA (guanosine(46)-N7)-methyltransferase TrmB [bacterium]MCB9513217.1 tRNA (guanosine(46)-N7)-methyltransferase TrmB [Candidatus Latescibacterota bacterium]MCB9514681.1 tRNA (guanosine(46)-N7)-methyltransferase TrmB [Candidatus Latescibacterota bacterium]